MKSVGTLGSLIALTIGSTIAAALGCSSVVPATLTQRVYEPIDRDAGIFLIARQHRAEIIESLEDAGIQLSRGTGDMAYALEVRLGDVRARTRCGTVQNVSYQLMGAGQRLLVIKGRGPTGRCELNIFDDMSRELAANLN